MKKALTSAVAALVVLTATSAFAASFPTNFVLDTATSGLTIQLTALGSVVKIPINFTSGNLDTTIDQTGTAPPAVSLSTLDGLLNVVDTTVNATILGSPATFSTKAVELSVSAGGPFPNLTGTNPGTLDINGMPMGLTGGGIVYSIPAFGLSGTLNFATDPTNFTLPPGSTASINETGGPSNYTVTLSIPISIASTIPTSVVPIPLLLTGALNFVGTKNIPEPGSIALLGLGVIGIALPAVRRYRRRGC